MSRFLVSLLRHTLSSEDVKACEALVAKFGKDARDVSWECSRVRFGDVCCESGKTVLGPIKHSENTAEGVDRFVAVLVLLLGNVAVCSHTCTWLRAYVTSLSRCIGDGVDDIKALDLPGPSRRRARDSDVDSLSGEP